MISKTKGAENAEAMLGKTLISKQTDAEGRSNNIMVTAWRAREILSVTCP